MHNGITENNFTAEENYILSILRKDGIPDSFYGSIEKAHQFALKNGLSPFVFHTIKDSNNQNIPFELYNLLKRDYLNALFRNIKIQAVWKELKQIFNENNLTFVPLKGVFLAENVYPDFNTRPMSDIDVLLFNDDAKKVFDILKNKGAIIFDEKSAEHDKKTGHHLPGIYLNDVLIELHTSLFPLDMKYQIPNEILQKKLITKGNECHLHPLHNMAYLCLHTYTTMRRGGVRLSWFLDLILLSKLNSFKNLSPDFVKELKTINIWEPVIDILTKAEFIFEYRFKFLNNETRKFLTNNEANRFIEFIQQSEQQKTDYSYTIVWERLKNTKGLKNKLRFIKSALTRGGKKNPLSILTRFFSICIRLIRAFFSKQY